MAEEQQTHVYGEGFILGLPGKFANATVLVDASGKITSRPLGSTPVENEAPAVEEIKDVAHEQAPIVEVVEEVVPPVQIVQGG